MNELLDLIAQRVLICDGAMGTALHAVGNSLDQALPAVSVTAPDVVAGIHAGYVDAGVDIIQTNTFGASRLRLAPFGLADRVGEINAAAVRIAHEAAARVDRPIFVAGSVSPAVTVGQRSTTPAAERIWAHREQIVALADAGVDLLILETFGFVNELVEAVTVAAEYCSMPIVAQATFMGDGRTLSGHTPRQLVQALANLPVSVIGINCTLGPQGSLDVVTELAKHTELPLSAQPNAGLPRRLASDRLEYDVDPEYFARYAERLVASGAALVGGCCGTTALHLEAVAKAVHAARPPAPPVTVRLREEPEAAPPARSWLATTVPLIGAVLVPTSPSPLDVTLDTAGRLQEVGANAFMVAATQASGRTPRHSAMSRSIDIAMHLQDRLHVPAIAGVNTWNRPIMALQAQLLGAQARGVKLISCETGNPPLVGDYPILDGTWDVDSIGLIELLSALNGGVDHNGLRIASDGDFQIGTRINPGARDLDAEIERCLRKIDAGAHFLISRVVFELSGLETMLEAIDGALPVVTMVRPLRSFEEAEFLRYEVPDIVIPAELMDRMEQAGDGVAQVGLEAAAELAIAAGRMSHGVIVGRPDNDPGTLVPLMQSLASALLPG